MKLKRVFCTGLAVMVMLSCITVTAVEEKTVGVYNYGDANGTFEGNANELKLTTNGSDIWGFSDNATFYCTGEYDFLYEECSNIELTATVHSLNITEGMGDGSGSFGLMMRGGLEADDPNVYLRLEQGGGMKITYRNGKNVRSQYVYAGSATLSQTIRLTRNGDTFMAYMLGEDGEWVNTAMVDCDLGKKVYVGVAGFSHVNNSYLQGHFTDIKSSSFDTYDADFFGSYTETEILPMDVLLKEKFNDGSFTSGEESAINPIWDNAPKYYLSERDANDDIWLWRNGSAGEMTTGDIWTDYKIDVDVKFKDSFGTRNGGIFKLRARCLPNLWYGESHYELGMIDGTKIQLTKGSWNKSEIKYVTLAEKEVLNFIDNRKHTLTMSVVDNVIEGYLDGQLIIRAVDEVMPILKGKVGFYTESANLLINDFQVTKISDRTGGDIDNNLAGGYDKSTSLLNGINQIYN